MHKFILNIYYRNNHIEFDMTKVNTVYIGNNTNSTIPIPSESISKKELKITKKNTLLNIDCLSGNGLIFKGKSVKNAKSGNCDVFSFGKEFSVVAIPIIYDNDKNNIIQVDISNKNLIYIGSSKKNTIYINNRLISSVHCCIEKDSQNNFIIKDLDSRNGVFANSKPVKATVLDKNTVINIVGIKIKVLNNILYIDPKGFDIEFRGLNSFNNTDISSIRNSYKKEISKKSIILFKRSPRIIPTYEKGVITIEDPPQISITPTISWFQVLIMPLVTTSIFVVMISMGGSMRYLYMSGTLAIVGILGALVNYFSQVKKHKKDCISRKEKYYAYLESLKTDFENIKKTYIGTILKNYPKVDECINFIKNLDKNLWERTPDDFDFLNIMIGNGILDFPYEIIAPEQKVFEEKDDLISNAVTLKDNFKSINNLPITLNIKKSGTIGLTGDRNISFDILKSMIIQISSLHSYDEVKIVCLYSEKESEKWEWIRWLPHSWNNERTIRYISNSKESSKVILNDVYDIIYRRKNQNSDNLTPLPYYIVFISDLKLIKNTPVYDYLIYNNEH
ncbi:MAG: FHA domain-containing protein, partial [Clostridiales bacterium]